jgi:hypothetical protein
MQNDNIDLPEPTNPDIEAISVQLHDVEAEVAALQDQKKELITQADKVTTEAEIQKIKDSI